MVQPASGPLSGQVGFERSLHVERKRVLVHVLIAHLSPQLFSAAKCAFQSPCVVCREQLANRPFNFSIKRAGLERFSCIVEGDACSPVGNTIRP